MVEYFMEYKGLAQQFKKPAQREISPILTRRPNDQMQIDFIDLHRDYWENNDNRYILTAIDHFSKKAWAFALKSRDSMEAVLAMRKLFDSGVRPRTLHADGEFGYPVWQQLYARYEPKILYLRSQPYFPQANGCIERFNRTLKTAIKLLQVQYGQRLYLDVLDQIVDNYNNTIHSSHKMTPNEVYYGTPDVIERALVNATKYRASKIFRGSTQNTDVEPGDRVRLSVTTDSKERMNRIFKKKGYDVQFTPKIYTITKHLKPINPLVNHRYQTTRDKRLLYRSEIQPIVYDYKEEKPLVRPEFNPNFKGGRTFKNIDTPRVGRAPVPRVRREERDDEERPLVNRGLLRRRSERPKRPVVKLNL
jgi:hypothetical protein